MAGKTRNRSARTGQMVTEAEAQAKPAETIREKTDTVLAKRVARLEQAIVEFGGPLARIFDRLG